jgi:hypothetical protein
VGFCVGVLTQDAHDLLFHVDLWLASAGRWLRGKLS